MKTKNILKVLGIGLLIAACNPMEDIYDDIDQTATSETNVNALEYEMTSEDYETLSGLITKTYTTTQDTFAADYIVKYETFNDSVSDSKYIPLLLASQYSALGVKSSINMTYNYEGELRVNTTEYANAEQVTLSSYDYKFASSQVGNARYFTSKYSAEELMGNVLKNIVDDPEEGQIVVANYLVSDYQIPESIITTKSAAMVETNTAFEMESADYQIIVDYVKANIGEEWVDSYGTGESYYGAGSYYANFDIVEDGSFNQDVFATGEDAIKEAIKVALLPGKFPEAATGDTYDVTFATYSGVSGTGTFSFICTADAASAGGTPTFDLSVITYELTEDDYQLVVDYVYDNIDSSYVNSYGTSEEYYGANAYYANFAISSGSYADVFPTWEDAVKEAIALAILPSKYPDAEINNSFEITFASYPTDDITSFTFVCTKSSPNPEFVDTGDNGDDNPTYMAAGFYQYDGSSWGPIENTYILSDKDYDEMGMTYGSFSSYSDAKEMISEWLTNNVSYMSKDEPYIVGYQLYQSYTYDGESVSKTIFTASDYNLTTDGWENQQKTSQFILTSDAGWVFDPTVNYTMVSEDYQVIVDYVAKTFPDEDYVDSYGTAESYYGSSAYYAEFRIKNDYFETDVFETWEDAATEAIRDIFLPTKFTDAVAQSDGIDVKYVITFAGYESSMVDYTITFVCTKDGPNAEFELDEENGGPIEAE